MFLPIILDPRQHSRDARLDVTILGEDLRLFQRLGKLQQPVFQIVQVELLMLFDKNTLNVLPVFGPPGYGLLDNQVFWRLLSSNFLMRA